MIGLISDTHGLMRESALKACAASSAFFTPATSALPTCWIGSGP